MGVHHTAAILSTVPTFKSARIKQSEASMKRKRANMSTSHVPDAAEDVEGDMQKGESLGSETCSRKLDITVFSRSKKLATDTYRSMMHSYTYSHTRCDSNGRVLDADITPGQAIEIDDTTVRFLSANGDLSLVWTPSNDSKGIGEGVLRFMNQSSVIGECDMCGKEGKSIHRSLISDAQLGGCSLFQSVTLNGKRHYGAVYTAQLPSNVSPLSEKIEFELKADQTDGRTMEPFQEWSPSVTDTIANDWGERMEATEGGTGLFIYTPMSFTDIGHPVLPVPQLITNIPKHIVPAQPAVIGSIASEHAIDVYIVFTGYDKIPSNFDSEYTYNPLIGADGVKLGSIGCNNRPSGLYGTVLKGDGSAVSEPIHLTKSLKSASSPRVSPSGQRIVFLSHEIAVTKGVHSSSASLMMLDYSRFHDDSSLQSVPTFFDADTRAGCPDVPLVEILPSSEGFCWCGDAEISFPGLYAVSLPEYPFLNEEEIIVNTVWGSANVVLIVNIVTKKVTRLDTGYRSTVGLACSADCILVQQYNYVDNANRVVDNGTSIGGYYCPATLMVHLREQKSVDQTENVWGVGHVLDPDLSPFNDSACPTYEIVTDDVPATDGIRFEAIVIHCLDKFVRDDKRVHPVVLIPHGGPHGWYDYYLCRMCLSSMPLSQCRMH